MVILEGIIPALIMSFPVQTINKIPLKTSHIIIICSYMHNYKYKRPKISWPKGKGMFTP